MACLDGWPSEPFGWNASNSAVRSASVCSLVSVSERICTVSEAPLPTTTTDSGALPMVLLKTSSTCWVLTVPFCPAAGIDTVVPPSKSMPKVKPRSSDGRDRDHDDQPSDEVPHLAPADDIERAGTGVQPR